MGKVHIFFFSFTLSIISSLSLSLSLSHYMHAFTFVLLNHTLTHVTKYLTKQARVSSPKALQRFHHSFTLQLTLTEYTAPL